MELDEIRDLWDQAARKDAMGHILTTGQPWDRQEFFETGRVEIAAALARLDELGLRSLRRRRALDFGCGVGRLTLALAESYERVDGIDIAEAMVDQADRLNQHPKRVRYHRLDRLPGWWTGVFDLVYSNLVLQHMPQQLAHRYIADFVRLLRPDGTALFEIPEGPDLPHSDRCLSMWASTPDQVEQTVQQAGGVVADTELVYEPSTWRCYRYTARRA